MLVIFAIYEISRVAKVGIDSYFEKKIIIQEENDKILEKSPFLEVL